MVVEKIRLLYFKCSHLANIFSTICPVVKNTVCMSVFSLFLKEYS